MLTLNYPEVWFTYGPQTKEDSTIRELIKAGATGARLTFSFGTPDLQVERARQLRSAADDLGRQFLIVADLQGEKCRFSKIENVDEIAVRTDTPFLIVAGASDLTSNPVAIAVQIPEYIETLEAGDVIVEGDGALIIRVIEKTSLGALCAPETDGVLHPGRGLLVQKRDFRPKSMVAKDRTDLVAVIDSDVFDGVAVSFVASADDVNQAKGIMRGAGTELPIISKIETQKGVDLIDEIANVSDAVMIARGDLALTAPWIDLYSNVVKVSQSAKRHNVPWILATQIAEGLEHFEFPTRAEICDLAHWVSEGADAVMLSFETAFGRRPIGAIRAVRDVFDRYKIPRNV